MGSNKKWGGNRRYNQAKHSSEQKQVPVETMLCLLPLFIADLYHWSAFVLVRADEGSLYCHMQHICYYLGTAIHEKRVKGRQEGVWPLAVWRMLHFIIYATDVTCGSGEAHYNNAYTSTVTFGAEPLAKNIWHCKTNLQSPRQLPMSEKTHTLCVPSNNLCCSQ